MSTSRELSDRLRIEADLREAKGELAVVLREVADGITVQDPSGRLVYANDAAARLIGFGSAEALLEAPLGAVMARFDVLDEHGDPFPLDELPGRLALRGLSPPERTVGYRIRATGEVRWSVVRASPVLEDDGAVRFAVNVFQDISERKRGEDRTRFLAEAGELLASSLDYERTLARLAQLAVPRIGDWCMVYMRAEDGSIERLAVEHARGAHSDVLERLRDYPFDPDAAVGVPAVLRTGEAQLHADADSALVASDVVDSAPLAEELESLGIRSWMCVPLVARERTIGAISVLSAESGRRFDDGDVALAQELARRAAMAVENARLYRRAQETAATLDALVATAPVGLGFWDSDFRFVRINDALAELHGIAREEHLSRTLHEVLPELAPTLEPLFRRVLETGEPLIGVEVSGETPARPGVNRHWLATYYPVPDASGVPIGIGAIVSDITERKRAEDALHRSEERFRSLVTATTQVIWTTDGSGSMVERAPTWEAFTGQSPDDYLGPAWGWRDAIHPDDRERAEESWREAVAQTTPLRLAYRLRRRDGEYRHVLGSAVPVKAADGSVREWVGTNTDIESEQVARAAAEEAQRRLSFLGEASRQLATSLDFRQTLTTIVDLCVGRIADSVSVLLVGRDGAVRRAAGRHVDPELDEALRRLWESYPIAAGRPSSLYEPLARGEPVLIPEVRDSLLMETAHDDEQLALLRSLGHSSLVAVPLSVGDRLIGALTIARGPAAPAYTLDDLELAEELARRASVALDNARLFREAEERARAVQALEFVADGVFVVDREGAIRLWNPAAASITGLAPADVVGRVAGEAIRGWADCVDRVPVADPHASGSVRPETLPLELGGRELWVSISGVGFSEGTVFAFRDVTEERGVEKMKSDFVSTVSHELRTPLAAIYGAAVTLRRTDMPLVGDQRDELLAVISSEAERLARIVNDILWTSRIESGGLQVTIEHCDPRALASDAVQSQRLHLPPGIELELVYADGVPELAADPDKVRQVLANLVDNAVKYSPDGGRVELAVAHAGDCVRFLVSDEGLGIPPAEQERVFEKFYRLDPNLTRGVGGTGLGLYICRELVRRMGGGIWVESRPEGGSVFVVELPAARELGSG